MRNTKRICAAFLAAALVLAQLPVMEAKAADTKALAYEYDAIGNTGAVITVTSGKVTTATVEDATLATATVAGDTVTVTGAKGATGVAKVTLTGENGTKSVVEVPVGYTTFEFDGDSVRVYEGSDGNFEVTYMDFALQDNVDATGTDEADGSVSYTNTDAYKVNVEIKKKGGTYVFTGKGDDMCIAVKKEATGVANLLLAGLDLSASYTAPMVIKKDSEDTASVNITALEGHTNVLTDAEKNNADNYGDTEEDGGDGTNVEFAESACIKGKTAAKVTIDGKGTLRLNCATKNAIKIGESGYLVIKDVDLDIVSAGHGISSDNILTVESGDITIDAASDAMRSDPDTVDANAGCAGNVIITGGTFDIKAGSDGIQAAQDVNIADGIFTIQTGAGYNDSSFNKDTMSCKGIKASCNNDETTDTSALTNTIDITGGTFNINTPDDAVHSDAYIVITGGDFDIYTGDDGVHADTSLTLGEEGGSNADVSITVNASYEALEGGCVYIYSGTYKVESSDDGINAAGDGTSTGGSTDNFNPGGGPGRPGQGGGGMGVTTGCNININGGDIYVNANGDGLDANDSLNISGGKTIVFGAAASSDNQPLDCDGTITISGGTVFAAGSSGMAVNITATQNYITSGSSSQGGGFGGGMRPGGSSSGGSTISAGKTINVKENGTTVFNIITPKNVNYVLYSSPDVESSGWTIDADDSELIEDPCKNGHTFKNYVSNNDATTEKDGTKTAKCEYCDATDTITDIGSKLPSEGDNSGSGSTNIPGDSGSDTPGTGDMEEPETGSTIDLAPGEFYEDAEKGFYYEILTVSGNKGTIRFDGAVKETKKLVIPDKITIGEVSFKVTEIAADAISSNGKVKNLTIGKNVTTIGKNAFAKCKKLKTITIKTTKLKKVGKKAISGINKKAVIKVPNKKTLKTYKKLFTKKTGFMKTMKIKR